MALIFSCSKLPLFIPPNKRQKHPPQKQPNTNCMVISHTQYQLHATSLPTNTKCIVPCTTQPTNHRAAWHQAPHKSRPPKHRAPSQIQYCCCQTMKKFNFVSGFVWSSPVFKCLQTSQFNWQVRYADPHFIWMATWQLFWMLTVTDETLSFCFRLCSESSARTVTASYPAKFFRPERITTSTRHVPDAPSVANRSEMEKRCFYRFNI